MIDRRIPGELDWESVGKICCKCAGARDCRIAGEEEHGSSEAREGRRATVRTCGIENSRFCRCANARMSAIVVARKRAGVSFCPGPPSRGGLLGELAQDAGFLEDDQKALSELDYLDQPALIEERMGLENLRPPVAKITNGGYFTPAHSILAEVHVACPTTNFDALLERESADKIERLPWSSYLVSERDTTSQHARYVTKIHACVSHPPSIVLTRRDYLRDGSR